MIQITDDNTETTIDVGANLASKKIDKLTNIPLLSAGIPGTLLAI